MEDIQTLMGEPKGSEPISPWVLSVCSTIIAIGVAYGLLRANTDEALASAKANAEETRKMQMQVMEMKSDLRSLTERFAWFASQYEKDATKYIREKSDVR